MVGRFFLAALRLCATTRLLPPPDRTTVAVAVFSPSQLSPLLNGDVQKTLKANFSLKHLFLLLLCGSLLSFFQQLFTALPAALRWYVSPLGSRPPLDCKEAHREHARWELRGSEVTVSHPQSPHVITWHLSLRDLNRSQVNKSSCST